VGAYQEELLVCPFMKARERSEIGHKKKLSDTIVLVKISDNFSALGCLTIKEVPSWMEEAILLNPLLKQSLNPGYLHKVVLAIDEAELQPRQLTIEVFQSTTFPESGNKFFSLEVGSGQLMKVSFENHHGKDCGGSNPPPSISIFTEAVEAESI
jgi:hypothetical protein